MIRLGWRAPKCGDSGSQRVGGKAKWLQVGTASAHTRLHSLASRCAGIPTSSREGDRLARGRECDPIVLRRAGARNASVCRYQPQFGHRLAARNGGSGMRSPRYITLKEVARRYGVSYVTARKWALYGLLPAFQIGPRRPWRIDLDALERMERGGSQGPAGTPLEQRKA